MSLKTILACIGVMLLSVITNIASKEGLRYVDPSFFTLMRFIIVVLIFIWFVPVPKEHISKFGVLGFLFFVSYALLYEGLNMVTVSSFIVICQAHIVFSILLGVLVLKERLNGQEIAACMLCISGIIIIFGVPDINFFGVTMLLIENALWAGVVIYIRTLKPINTVSAMTYMAAFSLPWFVVYTVCKGGFGVVLGSDNDIDWYWVSICIVIVAIFSHLFMSWYQKLIAHNDVKKIAPFMVLQPLFTVTLGIIIFDDPMSPPFVFGGLLVVIGLLLNTLNKSSNSPPDKLQD